MFPYHMLQYYCSLESPNLQMITFTKICITFSKQIEMIPNKKNKEYNSSHYLTNIYLQGFQAVHGGIRPGTNTKTENPIKTTTIYCTKKCLKMFSFFPIYSNLIWFDHTTTSHNHFTSFYNFLCTFGNLCILTPNFSKHYMDIIDTLK